MGTREVIDKYRCNTSNHLFYENYDPCFPDQPVVDLYLPIWANHPTLSSKPAFIWAEDGGPRSSITYSHLNSSTRSIASQLLISLHRGDAVLILCSPGLELVKILFSCQRAGLLSIPISPPDLLSFTDPKQTPQHYHLLRVLLQIKPKAAIAHSSYIAGIRRCAADDTPLARSLRDIHWIPVEHLGDSPPPRPSPYSSSQYSGCGPDEVYLIQYTSGATGIPKPVLVTAGAAAHNVRVARKAYDLQPNSVIVSWLPQYHDCGLMFLLLTVVSGASCVLASPSAFVRRPRFWVELITEFQATCTPVPSFTLPLVLRRGRIKQGRTPLNLCSLRNLVLINEPIYRDSVEEFVKEFARAGLQPSSISPSYGLAENCTYVSTAWRARSSGAGGFPNMPSHNKLLPSAILRDADADAEEDEMVIVVVDEETCEAVEDGVEGEIWVSSPSNASGYLGYPSLTLEVFGARLSGMARRFVRTGDRGVVRGEERYVFVTGRVSDVIKIMKSPEMEAEVELHPHQLETAAYNSCRSHLRGGCIAALGISESEIAVVAELQQRKKEEDGRAAVYGSICGGMREAVRREMSGRIGIEAEVGVVLVESGSLPKTTSGKLQRWAAKGKLMRGDMKVVFDDRGRDHTDSMNVVEGDEKRRECRQHDRRLGLMSML